MSAAAGPLHLLAAVLSAPVHRAGCTGQVRVPEPVAAVARLMEAMIDLKYEWGDALNACPPPTDIRKQPFCNDKCLRCDLARLEAAFYRLRGATYEVPDCCARSVHVLNQGTREHFNGLADAWELPLPFPGFPAKRPFVPRRVSA